MISFDYGDKWILRNKNAEPASSMIQHRIRSGQYRTKPTGELLSLISSLKD